MPSRQEEPGFSLGSLPLSGIFKEGNSATRSLLGRKSLLQSNFYPSHTTLQRLARP